MGTRFYLRYTEAPAVSPTFDTGAPFFAWSSSVGAVRCTAKPTKLSGDNPQTIGPTGITNNTQTLFTQGVSDVLPTGTVFSTSTTVKAYIQCSEGDINDNGFASLRMKVVSEDGATTRQQIYAQTASATEAPTTLANVAITTGRAMDLAYTTVAGDRLVIEIGGAIQAGASPVMSLRFGSAGGDLPEGASTDTSLVPWVEFPNLDIFPAPPATPSGPGVKVGLGLDSAIGWEIDGKPVRMLGDWQAEVATNWGERTFTGTVSKDITWVDQGSTIIGWRRSGEPIWQGTVVAEPRIDGERLRIRGEGFARKLAENRTRMFYRIDGFAGWSDKEEDPYAGTNNDKYDLTVRPGILRWRLDPSDAFSTNDQAGFATWVEGGEITKYSFVVTTGASYGAFDLEYQRFTGPTGTKSTVNTHTLNPVSSPITGTMTVSPEDAAVLRMIANTNAASGTRRVVTVTQGKLYGRTNDDNFSLSDVCEDVGQASGFGTDGVVSNALLILPLDWTDPHPGLLDYMTELADWLWMIRGQELIVKPYGQIWETATDVGAKPQLEPEPQANIFVQPYRTVSGTLRKSTATATTDPFPGQEIIVWGEELEDPQANSDLPDAVARSAVEFESSFRASGTVELTEVRLQGSVHLPYDVEAGDQLQLTDLAPQLGPQRVEAITYRPNNHATATVGQAFDLVRTLAENERPARRRRRKRSKKRPPPGGMP